MTKLVLAIGTAKGLFLATSKDRRRWRIAGPHLPGLEINHAVCDRRTGNILATANSVFYGSRFAYSKNFGKKWGESGEGLGFDAGTGLKLQRLWHIEPGREGETETIYCGVAPAALFRSDDSGKSWREVTGLTSHESRPKWEPGAGGLCLHTIIHDPDNSSRMWIGISAVGIFRSDDGEDTWTPMNKGVRAEFFPERYPEYGQCVHDAVMSPGGRLYQQNHCGVYRSDDGAESWDEVTTGLPSDFGFPIGVHPRDSDTAYVIPLQGAELRCPPEGKLRVWRTRDGGKTWEPLTKGLPQRNAYMGIYREGISVDSMDPAGIYFGTNTGHVYMSADEGDGWRRLTADLPPVYSLSAAVLD